jgi:hypothetical protein
MSAVYRARRWSISCNTTDEHTCHRYATAQLDTCFSKSSSPRPTMLLLKSVKLCTEDDERLRHAITHHHTPSHTIAHHHTSPRNGTDMQRAAPHLVRRQSDSTSTTTSDWSGVNPRDSSCLMSLCESNKYRGTVPGDEDMGARHEPTRTTSATPDARKRLADSAQRPGSVRGTRTRANRSACMLNDRQRVARLGASTGTQVPTTGAQTAANAARLRVVGGLHLMTSSSVDDVTVGG